MAFASCSWIAARSVVLDGFAQAPGGDEELYSPGDGESGARARLASRNSSVATSVWQFELFRAARQNPTAFNH